MSLMLPEPAAVQVPPPAPTQVQVQVSEAGKVSATVAPVALLGPALRGHDRVGHRAARRGRRHAVRLGDRRGRRSRPACRVSVALLLPAFGIAGGTGHGRRVDEGAGRGRR